MKNTGKTYEKLTERVFKRLIKQGELVANVQRDVVVVGNSTKHQIDVTFEFAVGPISYRTIVQCKDWNSPVKQEQVLAFNSVLTDIPGQPRGIIVSKNGFQAGAKSVAEHHGIKLYELRAPKNEDWDGLLREIILDLNLRVASFDDVTPIIDDASLRSEMKRNNVSEINLKIEGDMDQLFVEVATGEMVNVRRALNSLVPKDGDGPFRVRHDFAERVIMLAPDLRQLEVPVLAIEATVSIGNAYHEAHISLDHFIAYSFKDVLAGTVRLLREDGSPLGESDEEQR